MVAGSAGADRLGIGDAVAVMLDAGMDQESGGRARLERRFSEENWYQGNRGKLKINE